MSLPYSKNNAHCTVEFVPWQLFIGTILTDSCLINDSVAHIDVGLPNVKDGKERWKRKKFIMWKCLLVFKDVRFHSQEYETVD